MEQLIRSPAAGLAVRFRIVTTPGVIPEGSDRVERKF
jgi:hypothetical protein